MARRQNEAIEEMSRKLDRVLESLHEQSEGIMKLQAGIQDLTKRGEEHQVAITELMTGMKRVEKENKENCRNIEAMEKTMEKRFDVMEQAARMNDVVLTGLRIKPRSYARLTGENDGEQQDHRSMLLPNKKIKHRNTGNSAKVYQQKGEDCLTQAR